MNRTSVDKFDTVVDAKVATNRGSLTGYDFRGSLGNSLSGSLLKKKSKPSDFTLFCYKILGQEYHEDVFDILQPIAPQMWKFHNVGLYAHYGALGLLGAIAGLCYNFCYYYYDGSDNVCANSYSLIFVPWGFKIFFAMVTDSFRPFGYRRKSYMIVSWILVLILTLFLALTADQLNVGTWIGISLFSQFLVMVADVPADGYSVEIGQMESGTERGMVLANGQKIRFAFTMLGGVIQALLVNGPKTNDSDCAISIQDCWSWGLTVRGYYAVIFVILAVLCIPILFFREVDCSDIPQHSLHEHAVNLWDTLQNPTTMYLLIFVLGNSMFSNMAPITTTYVQYILIQLTNLQSGITAIVVYCAVYVGIYIFQKYFLNRNWRTTLYLSVLLAATFNLMWILVYYNVGGLLNPWFTIFITLNTNMAQGISQVLFSMAVIEVAKKGQEAISYELIVSVANCALNLSTIVATQLLTPLSATSCDTNYIDDDGTCTSSQVNLNSKETYRDTDGPKKFTQYQLVIMAINVVCVFIFTQFLPKQKAQCHEWRMLGESGKYWLSSTTVGYISSAIAVTVVLYQVIAAVILLNPATACLPAFGGSGC